MNSFSIKDDLLNLKNKLSNLELELDNQNEDEKIKEERLKEINYKVNKILSNEDNTVVLNIGGKIFHTKISTLLNVKDTLFHKIALEIKNRESPEIFFDRSYTHFHILLDYMRTNKFCYKGLNKYDIDDLYDEAVYYSFNEIIKELEDRKKEIEIIRFDSSPRYSNCGTHSFEDLKNENLQGGICVQSPYYITFELNYEHEISSIMCGGWNGNTGTWYPGNGSGAVISTSIDNSNYSEVGRIPSNFGANVIKVDLIKSTAKFVKFSHNSYLGFGHLSFNKE